METRLNMKRIILLLMGIATLACSTKPVRTSSSAAPVWQEIQGGEQTICSNGTPYVFFFHPGNSKKLLVFFQGGGACWDPISCNLNAKPTYDPSADAHDNPAGDEVNLGGYAWDGIFNFGNPRNPFRDYSFLLIPYCTGDTHLGSKDVTYSTPDTTFTINHQGARNVQAALNWVYNKVPQATQVFVTGASAGSIASPVYACVIADHYPDARVAHLGDCSGAYRGKGLEQLLTHWGVPATLSSAGLTPRSWTMVDILVEAARKHPNLTFSQYNAAFDATQQFFLSQTGENPDSVLSNIQTNNVLIINQVPNYTAYVDTGSHHVVLTRPQLYTTRGGGLPFIEWLAELEKGAQPAPATCDACR